MPNAVCDAIATGVRSLPTFRGKARVGAALGKVLGAAGGDSIRTIRMKDGSLHEIDVRSRTERWTYWTGQYDPEEIALLLRLIPENAVVLDIGANVGFYTVALGGELKRRGGRLYAFEPVPSNFARIERVLALNDLQGVVTVNRLALGDFEGEIQLHLETANDATTGNAVIANEKVVNEDKMPGNVSAPILPLDLFVERHALPPCQLIKVDIEGAEMLFLKGGRHYLTQSRPIIFGEFNPYWLKQFGASFADVMDFFRPLNYRYFRGEPSRMTEFTEPTSDIHDVLLIPADAPESVYRAVIG